MFLHSFLSGFIAEEGSEGEVSREGEPAELRKMESLRLSLESR
jgi:hypothetical protein